MASYDEYAKKYQQEGSVSEEIEVAEQQSQERAETARDPVTGQFVEAAATPDVNWEDRYKELEKLNSRQAQDLGNYRKVVDEFIVDPTPAINEPTPVEAPHINVDDLYNNPEDAISKVVDSHPAIREARAMKARLEEQARTQEMESFSSKHSDFKDIAVSPEFQNWVLENPTRTSLAQSADAMDLTAADALFSLYKAEKGLNQVNAEHRQEREIANASLETPRGSEQPAPERYSRSEMLAKKVRAKQGDLEAEAYVNAHATAYRNALGSGNVRD